MMRFVGLYIRNNIRRRTSGYLITLFSFFLSALLICITIFYLTLEKNIQEDEISYPGFDLRIMTDAPSALAVQQTFAEADWLTLSTKLETVDLMPLYREEIADFDETPVHKTLSMTYVRPGSLVADLLAEYGLDITALSSDAVYVSPYVYYYFRDHIRDDILTLSAVTDADGAVYRLKIAGVMDTAVSDFLGAFIITADGDLFDVVREHAPNTSGILYYEVPDKRQPDTVSRRVAEEAPHDVNLSIRVLSGWQEINSTKIYSGDVAIAVFNLFFAALCMVCTLKTKFQREAADYRKMRQMGYAPIWRGLLPFFDLAWLGMISYVGALVSAVFLFRWIAPYEDRQSMQSSIYSYYFRLSADTVWLTAVLFGVMFLLLLGIVVYICVIRTPRTYHSYVKQSAKLYVKSKSIYLPYILVRFSRNKSNNLFFVFMLCFPLFVSAMYGTGAINLVSNDSDLFAEAAFTVCRDDVPYGSEITADIADAIRALDGVASVQMIHKSNQLLALSSQEHTLNVQLVERNAYTVGQLEPYLTEGSVSDSIQDHDKIILTDNSGLFSVGDAVTLDGCGKRLEIGAILRNVPLEYRLPMVLIDIGELETLTDYEWLPADLHVYLDEDISEETYSNIRRMMPNLICDPHASYQNQRDEIAVLDGNGSVVHDAASSMNILICVISVLSVFLYHMQQTINRQYEFDILHKMGLGNARIKALVHIESLILMLLGIGIFALLYGGYVSSIVQSIQASQAYQYADFSFAWREIIVISVSIISVVELANLSVMKKERRT